jgi:large subunit ribosomal protein L15
MKLSDLSPAEGSRQKKKRVGRGPGSGLGKTAGRGEKGQKSRSGYSRRPGFEGGQMPLIAGAEAWIHQHLPQGVRGGQRRRPRLPRGLPERVDPEILATHGLVRRGKRVKVLGDGELGRALTVAAHMFSKSARAKIEQAGGTCEELA